MFRIDGPTAAPGNLFTGGDPAVPTPPTIVTPEWLSAVQEELVSIVLAAGLTLDKTNYGQVLAAIRDLIASGGVALASDADAIAGMSTTEAVTPHSAMALVNARISALVNGAPGALDTLKELADAIADDANFAATMTAALAARVPTSRKLNALGLIQGGGDGTQDRSITVVAASGADMNAATDPSKALTPAAYGAGGGGTWARGWSVLPGGFIEQWGSESVPGSGQSSTTFSVVFPIPFQQGCGSITGNGSDSASGSWRPLTVTFPALLQPGDGTTTGATAVMDTTDPNNKLNVTRTVYWRAIGK